MLDVLEMTPWAEKTSGGRRGGRQVRTLGTVSWVRRDEATIRRCWTPPRAQLRRAAYFCVTEAEKRVRHGADAGAACAGAARAGAAGAGRRGADVVAGAAAAPQRHDDAAPGLVRCSLPESSEIGFTSPAASLCKRKSLSVGGERVLRNADVANLSQR